MKKVIGVMPLWDEKKDSIWMLPGYLNGLREAGGLPMIFPLTADAGEIAQLCALCDGFLLTGGHDVGPELYGETALPELTVPCPARDALEKQVLAYAIQQDKAVFGICRGIQFLNVFLGGTLYQDIPTQCPFAIDHRMKPPYNGVQHQVRIVEGSGLHRLLQLDSLGVNSCHHQGIRTLAPGLEVMAQAPDGLVEAVCLRDARFIWAVQWHPEFSHQTDANSRKLFSAFVEHC